ncbi:zinc ion transmembrane transporter [Malassezia pachydermatis]|uniref:Zip-like iron-zinc transporter n=1 Tax=Malassezia pachydermatis TaxID=77020 RepID=A0A0M9VNS2_9BASI|nr:zip-like iron-zinc transporter [Malassezia pachydermatis]KOS13665.1 zip-like iron-zinc transporter [Malassezia pachydermatis]
MDEPEVDERCSGETNDVGHLGTRIGALFVILVTSAIFTLFPIVTKRVPRLAIPGPIYDFAKYFGSGVIIATGFVHLLEPATDELSAPCLNDNFQNYPMAYAFCLISMMCLFVGEFFAYRFGTLLLEKKGISQLGGALHHHAAGHTDAHQHQNETVVSEVEHEDNAVLDEQDVKKPMSPTDEEHGLLMMNKASTGTTEIVGVFVLELGVVFHSVIIGLTLATTPWDGDEKFPVLFPVIVFHQLFEGLGLGSRLAFLPRSLGTWLPCLMAIGYSLCTPVGMAIGLGVRSTYTQNTPTGNYVTGIFDAISAGILIYTGLVELLAHDFVFNEKMHKAPLWKVFLNIVYVCAGIAIMALLGRWA